MARRVCLLRVFMYVCATSFQRLELLISYTIGLGSLLGVFRRFSQRPTCYLYDEYWSDLRSHDGRWLAGLQGRDQP